MGLWVFVGFLCVYVCVVRVLFGFYCLFVGFFVCLEGGCGFCLGVLGFWLFFSLTEGVALVQ